MQRWHLTKAVDRQLIEVKQTDGREILRQRERSKIGEREREFGKCMLLSRVKEREGWRGRRQVQLHHSARKQSELATSIALSMRRH